VVGVVILDVREEERQREVMGLYGAIGKIGGKGRKIT
jgi:hypothetical protein